VVSLDGTADRDGRFDVADVVAAVSFLTTRGL
jgi:hypothetical protein